MSTHAIHYLKFCDIIYVLLKEGEVVGKGTYENLKRDAYFQSFLKVV